MARVGRKTSAFFCAWSTMVQLLITLLVLVIVLWLVWWLLSLLPMPANVRNLIMVIVLLIALLVMASRYGLVPVG